MTIDDDKTRNKIVCEGIYGLSKFEVNHSKKAYVWIQLLRNILPTDLAFHITLTWPQDLVSKHLFKDERFCYST